ncbi:MAG: hypothetical protein ACKVJK_17320, partial [Methylophagaceae bacterium]
TVFEQIPNLATMLVPGAAAPQVARIGAGRLAATELAKRQATAQGIGVYMGSYALNAPEVFKNIYEETGELATGTAVLFGAAAAALDSVLPSAVLKNITPFEKSALAASVLRRSGTRPGITKSVLTGIAKGSGAEALTEGAQEAISISAENFVAGNSQYFDSEDWNRVMESAVRGAVAGGTFRGISEPFGRDKAQPKNVEPEVKEAPKQSDLQDNALKTKAIADVTEEEAKKNMKKAEVTTLGSNLKDKDGNIRPIQDVIKEQRTNPARVGYIRTQSYLDAQKRKKEVVEDSVTEAVSELPYEGFRPPEGMTLEAGIAYYNGLDAIEQANYQPPTQEAPVDEKQTDATAFGEETSGSGSGVLSGATDEVTSGIAELDGGEVGTSVTPVSTVGGGEGNVDPTLKTTGETRTVVEEKPVIEETVEQAWEAMSISEIPFAELSTENKQRLTEAKEDLGITGELVVEIDHELGFQESRAETQNTGETAETITTELVQEFGPNVNAMQESGRLVVVDSVEQLPANVKMSSTANGAYDSKSQTSYIVANRIEKGQGRRALLHEMGEHHGLEKMVGKDYTALLNRLKTLRKQNAAIDAIFGEVQTQYPELEVNNTLFRRMVGAVKNFLRRLGIYDVNRFSDADIQDMILNSLRVSLAEASSKSLASTSPSLQYSRTSPPGGVNRAQDNALFKYAGQVQQKMPVPTKEYIKGVWDK